MSTGKIHSHFTNPYQMGPQMATATSFEEVVKELGLAPEQYVASGELKAWVKRNKAVKFVPLDVLRIFGFTVDS